MIVSWNWLKDYVAIDVTAEEFAERLMMAGLNHESTHAVGQDLAIDLEVTSNRPDCLGHIGIAREAAVLFGRELKLPAAQPAEGKAKVSDLTSVTLEAPEVCRRYTARVIRGVKIGPSPAWLGDRLRTIGVAVINNVVDITNYVLMECGQPLHAFDFARLKGQRIIVRASRPGEKFLAIDHHTYELPSGTCVIADAEHAVALGGVMGGADSEVSPTTRDVLIESAEFAPMSIRTTARSLALFSDSSYRFERGVDPEGVEWASRRACQLILELAGGELAAGVIDVGRQPAPREPVILRLSQLKRILGIDIEPARVRQILTALGNREVAADAARIEVVPPSWRRDLSREIDLVEEAARIHGYDKIPEDVGVRMVASTRSREDRVIERVRRVLIAAGYNEAMTLSAVEEPWSEAFSPWTGATALTCSTPVLRRADRLRRSLVPSLLGARRTNESLANERIELFELASVYLQSGSGLPEEPLLLALCSGGDYLAVKGVIEGIVAELDPAAAVTVTDTRHALLDPARSAELRIGERQLGFVGEVSAAARKEFELRGPATVAEVRMSVLVELAKLVPQQAALSPYPAVSRDVNLVVDEPVRWAAVAEVVRQHGGPLLESIEYQDTYRDEARLGRNKKSLLFSISFRSQTGTLTREEVDTLRDQIVAQLHASVGGVLRA